MIKPHFISVFYSLFLLFCVHFFGKELNLLLPPQLFGSHLLHKSFIHSIDLGYDWLSRRYRHCNTNSEQQKKASAQALVLYKHKLSIHFPPALKPPFLQGCLNKARAIRDSNTFPAYVSNSQQVLAWHVRSHIRSFAPSRCQELHSQEICFSVNPRNHKILRDKYRFHVSRSNRTKTIRFIDKKYDGQLF